jgi:hypothetical protein
LNSTINAGKLINPAQRTVLDNLSNESGRANTTSS